ncbi:MAG: copper resistance protein CopC [Ornithinibacter sp.]
MPSRQLSVAVAVVVVAAFLFVAIAPAFATPAVPAALPLHASLVGSTPADGDSVETATEVVLSFNEEVNADFVQVVVDGPDGAEADGDPVVDGRDVTQALSAGLPAGAHTVTYRVVSTDGHPVAGSIEFTTTAAPATSPSTSPSQSASPTAAPSASPASTPTPSAVASPDVEPTSESGPSNTVWIALGIVAVALVATFIGLAVRGDRRSSDDPTA